MLSGRKEGREEDNMFRYEPACVNFSHVYAFCIISPLVYRLYQARGEEIQLDRLGERRSSLIE